MAENHISLEMDYKPMLPVTGSPAQLRKHPIGNGQISRDTQGDVETFTPNNHNVPKAEPEPTEDDFDDYDDRPLSTDPRSGVDDGLLTPKDEHDASIPRPVEPKGTRRSFGFPGYDGGTGMVDINGIPTQIPDVNAYQHKKTLAQGMMDLALLSANANQLRYVLESYPRHPYYLYSLILILMSIIFQIAVGVGLILNSRYNIKNDKEICRANKINNYTIIGIFIVTVVNVFISAFGVADPPGQN